MQKNTAIKRLLGVSATLVLLGAFSANAQKVAPVTGEANDHTAPGAVAQPAGKMNTATNNANPGVVPPQVGEANDQTSPNATERPAPKAKPMKHKAKKPHTKAPVTGEANDQTASGGTTEAAKAAKAAGEASK